MSSLGLSVFIHVYGQNFTKLRIHLLTPNEGFYFEVSWLKQRLLFCLPQTASPSSDSLSLNEMRPVSVCVLSPPFQFVQPQAGGQEPHHTLTHTLTLLCGHHGNQPSSNNPFLTLRAHADTHTDHVVPETFSKKYDRGSDSMEE